MPVPPPRLINPEWVTIRPLNRAATVTDELAGEPYAHLARNDDVRVLAQVDEGEALRRRPAQGGATVPVSARLTFKRRDLEAASYTPGEGDLVVLRESRDGSYSREVRWYVQAGKAEGVLARHGPSLVHVEVGPRAPDRTASEGL